jgi:hypothetical protein
MKGKLIGLIVFLVLIFSVAKVYSQDDGLTSIMSQNKIRTCLAADPTITKTQNRDCSSGDKNAPDDCEKFTLGNATEMHLTGTCDAPNGCEIWHEHGAREVNGLKAGSNKVVNHVAAGKVDVTVTGTFLSHVSHDFFAIGDAPLVTETGLGAVEGENRTQQVGEVTFQTFTSQSSQQSCTTIYWDPFGRVFDAISLEPITNVNVSLFQNPSKQLVFLPTNPAKTDNRGVYNILVNTEDDYYLNVDTPATHSFTKNVNLNPNYTKIYSQIYTPGEIFHESPPPGSIPPDFDFSPYFHDIPLQPKGEPYHVAVVAVISESLRQTDLGNFVNYWGQVTFPMAKVCLVGETSGPIGCTNADKYGNFQLNADKLSVPQELLEIKVEKVDLTKLSKATVLNKIISFFVKDVNAQSSISINSPTPTPKMIGFNPILSYIEGYAYGEVGVPIPNARITIKLKANDEVFYQTTTDKTGFFTIFSNHLPFFEYYFDITSPTGQTIKQTTGEFITFNQDYLNEQGLDLIKSTQRGSSIINPETRMANTTINIPTPTVTPQAPVKAGSQIIVIIILLLFLTVTLVKIIFYVVKKRK